MSKVQQVAGRQVTLLRKGTGGPVIFWGMFHHQGNEEEHLMACLKQLLPKQDFTVAAFQAKDWNYDFSPWQAPAAFGEENFGGGAGETLTWLLEECVPQVLEQLEPGPHPLYLAGYSLAGLFSLWTAYETDRFDGIVCCSGSLWFPGWETYVQMHRIAGNSRIYLSLGGKEEKTKNPVMAVIGDRTREQEKRLREDPKVSECILEWNSGGHFADSGKRLAKGIAWLMAGADRE